jgi:hypothetical protein
MPVDFNIDGQYKVNGVPLGVTSNPSVIELSVAGGTPVTGTTIITMSQSLLIPANTFTSNGMLEFLVKYQKTGAAGTVNCFAYRNTSPTLTGAVMIARYVNNSSSLYIQGIRTGRIISNTLTTWPTGAAFLLDWASNSGTRNSAAFTTSVDNYLIFAVQLANAADSMVVNIARAVIYS